MQWTWEVQFYLVSTTSIAEGELGDVEDIVQS
jgi:hypothetical protein